MQLLEQLGIADKAHAKVDEMSGGQQQRLMIARALIHEPHVIFLDEPTVGLDPQTRLSLWDILRALHAEGRTIVMTTHYMEEADKLCDRIAIVDRGELLELDTPAALKQRAPGGTLIEVTLSGDASAVVGRGPRASTACCAPKPQGPLLRVYSDRGGRVISPVIQVAEERGASVDEHQPHRAEPRDAVRVAHREEARLTAVDVVIGTRVAGASVVVGVLRAAAARHARRAQGAARSSSCARRCSRCSFSSSSATSCRR